MHREIAADAMAGAVVEVNAVSHSARRAMHRADAARALGKRAPAMAIWPFSTRVKRSAFRGRIADGDGARDVRGAVDILAAGVEEQQRARLEPAIGGLRGR